jgi:RNA polymerase sigma-70 factor (ECF subfamily)
MTAAALPIDDAHEMQSNAISAEERLTRSDDVALLRRAIDALPPKEKLALVLRDVEELSTEEVAAILGSRPATVRVQISKARTKLRQWIDAWRGGQR